MAITLKEIAQQAGVSVMAVSATLNQTTSTRVSEAKQRHIRDIAEKMGYSSNLIAQALRTGNSRVVGVVVDAYAPASTFAILQGIEGEANKSGYQIMVSTVHDSAQKVELSFNNFRQHGVCGIICLAHDYPEMRETFQQLLSEQENIVLQEAFPHIELPAVYIDPEPAYRSILSEYAKQGRKVALMRANDKLIPQKRRLQLFKKCCAEFGLEPLNDSFGESYTSWEVLSCAIRCYEDFIRPNKITAVLMPHDSAAAALLSILPRYHVNSPEDLAVIGWDNREYCDFLQPPLASFDPQFTEQGQELFRLLLKSLAGKDVQSVAIQCRYVPRSSAGIS